MRTAKPANIRKRAPYRRANRLNVLLAFVPVSIVLEWLHLSPTLVFVSSCLAIVPLAGLMGGATEDVAGRIGSTWGGLLNATFGNAPELIIAMLALRAGLPGVVKASITGSIIGNLLLVVGLAVLLGGIRHKTQSFNQHSAGLHSSLLVMSVLALMVPAVFVRSAPGLIGGNRDPRVESLSLAVAGVLIVVYGLSLFFSLKTHESLLTGIEPEAGEDRAPRGLPAAVGLLLGSTLFVALESEFLVGSIDGVTKALHLSQVFVGVVVVAIIGNAAEHVTAVVFARRNQMDLALKIAIGSSTQIALFVAPLLVFASLAMGHPMTFIFNTFELVSIAFAVTIVTVISLDGQTHWMEGVLLLAAYIVIALAFYYIPTEGRPAVAPAPSGSTTSWLPPPAAGRGMRLQPLGEFKGSEGGQ
ncbi:MAG TPA: calcium/proton exchanger [Armatimonadota bacterium]|jgi:Ca2+:H+ antiporter